MPLVRVPNGGSTPIVPENSFLVTVYSTSLKSYTSGSTTYIHSYFGGLGGYLIINTQGKTAFSAYSDVSGGPHAYAIKDGVGTQYTPSGQSLNISNLDADYVILSIYGATNYSYFTAS